MGVRRPKKGVRRQQVRDELTKERDEATNGWEYTDQIEGKGGKQLRMRRPKTGVAKQTIGNDTTQERVRRQKKGNETTNERDETTTS